MAYQVIARKWRPQTFDEVTGQDAITRTIQNSIAQQRIHHAYLLSGSRGVGKTTTARLIAKALNCHKSDKPTPTPCDANDEAACKSCREITDGRSNDVREIDAASNTGVDNVRSIIESVGIGAASWEGRSRYKVYIIDEVHMLSGAAFNALLKTIEEPPHHVIFIMATTERHKVPETILSRCQQFEFRTIATAKIVERLRLIAKSENISIPDDALREIARTGEGSMRDAQSALDQVISFAGDKIAKEDVELALGVAGADILKRIIDSIAANTPAQALAAVDDIVMRGHDLRNFCRDLLAHFRDLLVTKVSGNEELLESAVCEPQELKRQAELFSESDLVRFFHSLAETETKLRAATQPRYQLEIGIVKLMELRGVESISEIIQRLAALETNPGQESSSTRTPSGSGGTPTTSNRREPERPTTSSRTAVSSFAATAVAPVLEREIEEKLESAPVAPVSEIDRVKAVLVTQRKMLLVAALDAALATVIEEGELRVEFAPESRTERDTVSKPENIKLLREAYSEVTGKEIGIRILMKDSRAEGEPLSREEQERLEKQKLREMAENSPIVQQMLKTFRGEIVDVRKEQN